MKNRWWWEGDRETERVCEEWKKRTCVGGCQTEISQLNEVRTNIYAFPLSEWRRCCSAATALEITERNNCRRTMKQNVIVLVLLLLLPSATHVCNICSRVLFSFLASVILPCFPVRRDARKSIKAATCWQFTIVCVVLPYYLNSAANTASPCKKIRKN